MTNYQVSEEFEVYKLLHQTYVEYGDTIQLITSNQLGQKLYKVINENGNKSLFIVASADISEWDTDYNYSDEIMKYINHK
jgi:hypothetical protein